MFILTILLGGVGLLFAGALGVYSYPSMSLFLLFLMLVILYVSRTKAGADWWWIIDAFGLVGSVLYLFMFGEPPMMFTIAMVLFITGFGLNLIRKLTKKGATAEDIEKWEVRN